MQSTAGLKFQSQWQLLCWMSALRSRRQCSLFSLMPVIGALPPIATASGLVPRLERKSPMCCAVLAVLSVKVSQMGELAR